MNPIFHICQSEINCRITISGDSYDEGLYLDEDSSLQPYNKFKYSDTATINIIQLNDVDESGFLEGFIVDHSVYLDELHYKFDKDGFYTISHIILPTTECIERIYEEDPEFIEHYSAIYAINDNQIVKLIDYQWEEASFEELVERNTCDTTIFKTVKNMFSICHLWDCYVNICKELLKSDLSKCKNKNSDLESLTFNRDVVWMTINVLQYYISRDQLYEAERLLEEVNGCNGFCKESQNIIKRGGCGCGR